MKKLLVAILAVLLAGSLVLIFSVPSVSPVAGPKPVFQRLPPDFTITNLTYVSYDFLNANPFADGMMWVMATERAGPMVAYLFDIEKRRCSGKLNTGLVDITDMQSGTVLCRVRGPAKTDDPLLKWKLFINRYSRGLIKLKINTQLALDQESIWLVDLRTGRAEYLGKVYQAGGTGTTGLPSPNKRYWRLQSVNRDHLIADLNNRTAKIIPPLEWLQAAWCSDRELLYRNKSNDLEIYDVATDASRLALSFSDLARFLTANNLTLSSAQHLSIMAEWNGRGYDIYLTGNWRKIEEGERWLIKIAQPGFRPQLVSQDFPFRRLGHLNDRATKYLYSGERESQDSNAVYIRDIPTGQEHALVEGDRDKKYFSLPNFYGDRVIFVKDDAIWMMKGDGTGQEQLFPPIR